MRTVEVSTTLKDSVEDKLSWRFANELTHFPELSGRQEVQGLLVRAQTQRLQTAFFPLQEQHNGTSHGNIQNVRKEVRAPKTFNYNSSQSTLKRSL